MPPQQLQHPDLWSMLAATAAVCVGTYIHLHLISDLRQKSGSISSSSSRDNKKRTKSSSEQQQRSLVKVGGTTTKPCKKENLCQVAENLLCPITLDLPFDPVTAEDGRVYERSAIEKHFATKGGDSSSTSTSEGGGESNSSNGNIKSPITNQKMGTRLLAAPQHRNIIEALIESGAMEGELADRWFEKVREKKNMEGLMKRANQNDVKAMEKVAINYFRGENGFAEDDKQAYLWFKKCHITGCSVLGTAHYGYMLASGVGITRNKKEGLVFLSIAAGRGSDMAAYRLGVAFADGKYGLQINEEEATHWLKLSLSGECTCKTMNDKSTRKAQQKLDEVISRSSEDSSS